MTIRSPCLCRPLVRIINNLSLAPQYPYLCHLQSLSGLRCANASAHYGCFRIGGCLDKKVDFVCKADAFLRESMSLWGKYGFERKL